MLRLFLHNIVIYVFDINIFLWWRQHIFLTDFREANFRNDIVTMVTYMKFIIKNVLFALIIYSSLF